MSSCFYISSEGHSASGWLSKALNKNPNIISFHAIRSLPPINIHIRENIPKIPKNLEYLNLDKVSGYDKSKAEEFMWGLNQCSKHTDKSFGAVHTIWGLRAKDATEKLGGVFGGIIRHPISQFHSIMNSSYVKHLSNLKIGLDPKNYKYNYFDIMRLDTKNLIKLVTSRKPNLFLGRKLNKSELKTRIIFKVKHMKSLYLKKRSFNEQFFNRELAEVIKELSLEYILYSLSNSIWSGIRRVLNDHILFTENLDPLNIINMEKVTSDLSYFSDMQEIFTGFPLDNNYQNNLFELSHVNIHSRKKMSPSEIWDLWPDNFKSLFESIFFKNRNLLNYYESSNYWLPN